MSAGFIDHFATLEDPALNVTSVMIFMDIILLMICAVVSGTEGWEAIEEFGHVKCDWLKKYGCFDNRLPSHNCIARVISRLSPKSPGLIFCTVFHRAAQISLMFPPAARNSSQV